jgi:hypothetical protein
MPSLRAFVLIAVLFLLVVLLRLPAAWVVPMLPLSLTCEAPTGTIWNGSCGGLRVNTLSLAALSWQVIPGELLHGKLGVHLQLADAAVQASGKALLNLKGHVQGYDLIAKLPVPGALATGVPPGWSALLEFDLPRVESAGATLQSVHGVVRLRELQLAQPRADYGSFEWQLADDALRAGRVSGALRDLGGPVRLQGTLTVGLKGDYDLNAKLAAGPGAGDSLQQSLQQLGPGDEQGFRPLLAAGTL